MSGSKLKTPSMGFAVSIVNPVKHLKATHENGGKYAIMRFTGLGLIILNFIRARIAAAPGDC